MASIDDVDWGAIKHSRGPASDLPRHLRALSSRDRTRRRKALGALYGLLLEDGLSPASSRVVPLLIEMCRDPRVSDRSRLLVFLCELALEDPQPHLATGLTAEEARRRARGRGHAGAVYRAVASGAATFGALLADRDAGVRAASAYVLAFLTREAAIGAKAVVEAIDSEREPWVRAGELLCLTMLERPDVLRGRLEDTMTANRPWQEVWAAAAGLAIIGKRVPREVIPVLAAAIPRRPVKVERFPWHDGDISGYSALLLRKIGARAREAMVEALLEAIARDAGGRRGPTTQRRLMQRGEALLHVVLGRFHGRVEPVLPAELDPDQRRVLARLADLDVDVPFEEFGLVTGGVDLKRILEPDGDDPLDLEVRAPFKAKGIQTYPAWKWLSLLFERAVSASALAQAMQAQLSPEQLFAICRDGCLRRRDLPAPPTRFILLVLDALGAQWIRMHEALAEELLRRPEPKIPPPAAVFALGPLIRAQGAELDERYDPLLRRIMRSYDKALVTREVLSCIPAARIARAKAST